MKSEIKKIDSCTRELSIEIQGETVKNKFEDVFKKIGQEAKVKGFRSGNVPRDILEKNFSSVAHEQVLKELIPEVYQKVVDEAKLHTVDYPHVSDVKLERDSLSFKAQVEVMPEINIPEYKGIKIEYKKAKVDADEVKRSIDSMKESRKADNVDDAFAKILGYPNLDELKSTVEMQLILQKDSNQRTEIENHVVDLLTKNFEAKLPKAMINRQLDDLLRQAKMNLAMRGMPKEAIEEQEKKLITELEPQAQSQVKIYLTLSAIAEKETIALDDNMPRQVMEFIYKNADWQIK